MKDKKIDYDSPQWYYVSEEKIRFFKCIKVSPIIDVRGWSSGNSYNYYYSDYLINHQKGLIKLEKVVKLVNDRDTKIYECSLRDVLEFLLEGTLPKI